MDHHAAYSAIASANDRQMSMSTADLMSRLHIRNYESTMFALCEVYAEVLPIDQHGGGGVSKIPSFVPGVLAVVEKAQGVFVEWKPIEQDQEQPQQEDSTEDWVIEEGGVSKSYPATLPAEAAQRQPNRSPIKRASCSNNVLVFSADIKEVRSYVHEPAKKQGPKWDSVKFICRDGTSSNILQFRAGGYPAFVDCLQRYAILNRSAKEPNLVLLADSREDALKKSLGVLMGPDRNFVSRFMSNPYATSLTALSKLTNLVLEPESFVNDENQLREQIARSVRGLSAGREADDAEGAAAKLHSHNEAGFEHVFQLELPRRPVIAGRDAPVSREVWEGFRGPDGRVVDSHSLKSLIFRGGVEPALRSELWKRMLGYYRWEASDEENRRWRKEREEEYYRMKLQWMSVSEDQEKRFSDFRDRKALIEKDVTRTDRSHPFFARWQPANLQLLKDLLMTYCMYNFDLGYVQGMSDFLSPLLVVMEGNEVDTFWSFVGLMERVHRNFAMDQVHIRKQLADLRALLEIINPRFTNYLESHESEHMYFCFRWILVHFKREFSFEDTMYLWEVLWTDIPCKHFLLLFCVAILDSQMNYIIENGFGLAGILKHINGLSMRIDLEPTLRAAEAIYHQLAAVQDKLPRHICEILGFNIDEQAGDAVTPPQ